MPKTEPGIYEHWKGGLYRVLFTAHNSTGGIGATIDRIVVYVSLTTGNICVRTETEFHETIACDGDDSALMKRTRFLKVSE